MTSVTPGSVLDAIVNSGDWFTFSDFPMDSTAVNGIWAGPGGLSFDLKAGGVKDVTATGNGLTYEGAGTLHATGYQDTDGYFTFTTQKTPESDTLTFSFSAITAGNPRQGPNDVPDAGSTGVLLLGSLLGAAGFYRRCR